MAELLQAAKRGFIDAWRLWWGLLLHPVRTIHAAHGVQASLIRNALPETTHNSVAPTAGEHAPCLTCAANHYCPEHNPDHRGANGPLRCRKYGSCAACGDGPCLRESTHGVQTSSIRDGCAAEYDRMVMRSALRQIAAMDPQGARADDLGQAARVAREALSDPYGAETSQPAHSKSEYKRRVALGDTTVVPPTGVVYVCSVNDAACAEIPVSSRCPGCPSLR